MFSIYDSKAKAYLPPFIMHQAGMAIRVFADCLNDPGHQFAKNAGDYTLFHIGSYDDNTGKVLPEKSNVSLHNGLELIRDDYQDNPDQDELQLQPEFNQIQKTNSEDHSNA